MTEKVTIKKGSVQETLVIPLYGRMMASKIYPSLFSDPKAAEIISKLDYDFSETDKKLDSFGYRFGVLEGAMRQYDMAIEVRDYLKSHPEASVVNLGCGLDHTAENCDNGKCHIYNIDLPDVIEVRNTIDPPANERVLNIPCDLKNTEWMKRIDTSKGVIMLAAGVFYYFQKSEMQKLVSAMGSYFPSGSVLVFDIANKKAVKLMLKTYLKDIDFDYELFYVEDGGKEINSWMGKGSVSSRGYMLGYNDLKNEGISGPFRFLSKVGDGFMKMCILKLAF